MVEQLSATTEHIAFITTLDACVLSPASFMSYSSFEKQILCINIHMYA